MPAILTTKMESTSFSIGTFSQLTDHFFWSPNFLYPSYLSLNLQPILSVLCCHISLFLYQIESTKPYSLKKLYISVLMFFYLCKLQRAHENLWTKGTKSPFLALLSKDSILHKKKWVGKKQYYCWVLIFTLLKCSISGIYLIPQ